MKAVHGAKAKSDRIDSGKVAVLVRGGLMPSVDTARTQSRDECVRKRPTAWLHDVILLIKEPLGITVIAKLGGSKQPSSLRTMALQHRSTSAERSASAAARSAVRRMLVFGGVSASSGAC
jgi:hypothetical protein